MVGTWFFVIFSLLLEIAHTSYTNLEPTNHLKVTQTALDSTQVVLAKLHLHLCRLLMERVVRKRSIQTKVDF